MTHSDLRNFLIKIAPRERPLEHWEIEIMRYPTRLSISISRLGGRWEFNRAEREAVKDLFLTEEVHFNYTSCDNISVAWDVIGIEVTP